MVKRGYNSDIRHADLCRTRSGRLSHRCPVRSSRNVARILGGHHQSTPISAGSQHECSQRGLASPQGCQKTGNHHWQWRAISFCKLLPCGVFHSSDICGKQAILILSQAVKALLDFAKSTQIPVFHSGKFCFLFSLYESPAFAGSADALAMLKRVGSAPPDCVLLLGSRTGMYLGGRSGSIIPEKGCSIIQVDTDGGEIGRTFAVDVGIVANVGQALQALNVGLPKIPVQATAEWVKLATALKDIPTTFEKEPQTAEDGKIHPYHALASLFTLLPPDPIIVFDGGECACWAAMAAKISKPHTIVSSTGYLGFLGSGFGQALGCAVAAPHQMIVNIQGDGSAGFHFMDLDSYARHGLNVLTIVVNNNCWGMSANGQDLVYGEKVSARPVSSLSHKTDYAMIAKGLGNSAAKVDKISEIEPALMEVLSQDGPSCIELLVSRKPTHPVTKSMVGATEDKNVIVVPYYDNVQRPHYN